MTFRLRALAGLAEREQHLFPHFAADTDQDFFRSGEADYVRGGGAGGLVRDVAGFARGPGDQPMLGLVDGFGGRFGALRVPGPTVLELREFFLR